MEIFGIPESEAEIPIPDLPASGISKPEFPTKTTKIIFSNVNYAKHLLQGTALDR